MNIRMDFLIIDTQKLREIYETSETWNHLILIAKKLPAFKIFVRIHHLKAENSFMAYNVIGQSNLSLNRPYQLVLSMEWAN